MYLFFLARGKGSSIPIAWDSGKVQTYIYVCMYICMYIPRYGVCMYVYLTNTDMHIPFRHPWCPGCSGFEFFSKSSPGSEPSPELTDGGKKKEKKEKKSA